MSVSVLRSFVLASEVDGDATQLSAATQRVCDSLSVAIFTVVGELGSTPPAMLALMRGLTPNPNPNPNPKIAIAFIFATSWI